MRVPLGSNSGQDQLVELGDWLRNDRETRVMIFGGTGEVFCVEIDTPSFRRTRWHDVWVEGRRSLLDLDVPTISIVNGPARVHAELPVIINDRGRCCPLTGALTFITVAGFATL
jgi:hypothetical protein